jgi:hypothetical protein
MFDEEKESILAALQDQVMILISDYNSHVKLSIFNEMKYLSKLFKNTKTKDLLLSHLISLLNEKNPLLRKQAWIIFYSLMLLYIYIYNIKYS